MAEAVFRLKVDPSGARTGARVVRRELDLVKVGAVAATAAVAALGIAFGVAITAGVKSAKNLDAALAEASTLIAGTTEEMALMRKEATAMASQFGGSTTQQVEAFYQAISAGAGSVEEATRLLMVANQLAKGGVTDITTSVDILTSAVNAYEGTGLTASDASDILFTGVKFGKTTVDELAKSLGRVAPLAAKLGVGFDELVASTAALTKGGVATTEAVTNIRGVLAAILRPTSDAAAEAERLGIEFNAVGLEAVGFSAFLQEIVTKTGGSSESISKLFNNLEGLGGILGLVTNEGAAFDAAMESMSERAGATQEAADKVAGSLSDRLDVALGKIKIILEKVGAVLLGILVPALEVFVATAEIAMKVLTAFYRVGELAVNVFKIVAKAIIESLTPIDHQQVAIDNVTLAMGDQITQSRLLNAQIKEGTILTLASAKSELADARARQADIQSMKDKRLELILSSDKYQDLISDIAETRINLQELQDFDGPPNAFLVGMKNAGLVLQDELVSLLEIQKSMLAETEENTDAYAEGLAVIVSLESAIENAADGIVTIGSNMVAPIELSARLESNFAGVAKQARMVISALANAPSALLTLEQQAAVLQSEINSLASGQDVLTASSAAYRTELEQHYGLASSISLQEAIGISKVIDKQVEQYENNELLKGQRNDLLNSLTSVGSVGAPAIKLVTEEMEELGTVAESVSKSISGSIGDGLRSMVDGTKTAAEAFRSMAISIIEQLYDVMVVQKIVAALTSIIGGIGGVGSGAVTSGVMGSPVMRSANGASFDGGNVIPFASGGIVTSPTLFPMANGAGLMGEAGPEAIMPLSRGSDGKLGVKVNGSGSGTVVQNVTVNAMGDGDIDRVLAKRMPQLKNMVLAAVRDEQSRGAM